MLDTQGAPEIIHRGSYCEFVWGGLDLRIIVDRMRQHTDGRVSAEIVFKTGLNGTSRHLYQAQLSNVLGSSTKRDLAKELQVVWGSALLEWPKIIEIVSVTAVNRL